MNINEIQPNIIEVIYHSIDQFIKSLRGGNGFWFSLGHMRVGYAVAQFEKKVRYITNAVFDNFCRQTSMVTDQTGTEMVKNWSAVVLVEYVGLQPSDIPVPDDLSRTDHLRIKQYFEARVREILYRKR
jgi:hypothetical protein